MALVRPFEYVIQSRSTATLLHSISKNHKQSLINLYQLIFSSFLKSRERCPKSVKKLKLGILWLFVSITSPKIFVESIKIFTPKV